MVTAFVRRIYEHFENVSDPRVNRGGNYPLLEMVFVALCGALVPAAFVAWFWPRKP